MNLSNVKFLALIMAATVFFVPSALANQLEAYCISQVGQKLAWPVRKRPLVSVTVQGEKFHVITLGDDLAVIPSEGPPARVEFKQNITSHIEALALGKDGWLWIHGAEIDYMTRLDLSSKPPTLGNPVALPELYIKPCSKLAHFWASCFRAQGIYSPTLNRAFISGHRISLFGRSNPVGFEVIAGESKPLPTELKDARFLADLPKLNGVLLPSYSECR